MNNFKITRLAFLIATMSGSAVFLQACSDENASSDNAVVDMNRDAEVYDGSAEQPTVMEDSDELTSTAEDSANAMGEQADEAIEDIEMSANEMADDAQQLSNDAERRIESEAGMANGEVDSDTLEATTEVHFAFDSSELSSEAKESLMELVDELKAEDSPITLSLAGYTDNVGSAEYNKELSERRAESVKTFFVEQDIEVAEMEVVAEGEADNVAETATGREDNRRVEITIVTDGETLSAVAN